MCEIKHYLAAIKFLLESEDGQNSARLLSLRDPHSINSHLQVEFSDTLIKMIKIFAFSAL